MLRAAVVRSLSLFVLVVSALMSPTASTCTRDAFPLINTMKKMAPNWGSDTRLYTPTNRSFEECPRFTLHCLNAEVQVLLDEWNLTTGRITGITRIIGEQTKLYNKTEEGCGNCEKFEEQSADVFLNALKSTLQAINTMCSTATQRPL